MARLKGLRVKEFSLVRGDYEPANPGAVTLTFKADPTSKENSMKQPDAPVEKKSLAGQIADTIMKTFGKGVTVRTYENNYSSTATSTEKVTEDTPEPAASDATVVVVAATEKAQPSDASTQQPVQKTVTAPAAETVSTSDIAKAVSTGMEPVVAAITKIDERLTNVEKASVGSQVLKSTGVAVLDNSGNKFAEMTKFLSNLTPGQKLSKATIVTTSWAYGLSTMEATEFLQYMIDETALLKKVRTVHMTAPKMNIEKIGLGGKVLKKAVPGVDPGDTVSVTNPTQIQLNSQEVIAIVSISDSTLEDNIEGPAFLQKLLGMIGRAAGNELEFAAMHGDKSVADDYILDRWDGYLKRALAGGHVIEAMSDTDRFWPGVNGVKATKLIKALPTKFRIDKRSLGWIVHSDLILDVNDELASKGYSEAYRSITGIEQVPLRGIQQIEMPLAKTDISFTHSATPYTDGTFVMLTDLRNLIFGIQRDIRIEAQRNARTRSTDFVLTLRADTQIENSDAIALYNHAKVKA